MLAWFVVHIYMELVKNAFFLNEAIEAMRQHSRAGKTHHSHFRLNLFHLFSALRKQLAVRYPI